MSRIERGVAALLLGVAVAGGALLPHLLSQPAGPVGVARGPGPSRTVVRVPSFPKPAPRLAPKLLPAAPAGATPAAVSLRTPPPTPQPALKLNPSPPPTTTQPSAPPTPSPPPPPPTATVPSPSPPPPPPPTQTPKTVMHGKKTHPVHPVHPMHPVHPQHPAHPAHPAHGDPAIPPTATATAAAPTPTEPAKSGQHVRGSSHGKGVPKASSNPVGSHDRGVGHLAPTPPGAAPPAPQAGTQARPQTGVQGSNGGNGGPPPAVGQGQGGPPPGHGHGK